MKLKSYILMILIFVLFTGCSTNMNILTLEEVVDVFESEGVHLVGADVVTDSDIPYFTLQNVKPNTYMSNTAFSNNKPILVYIYVFESQETAQDAIKDMKQHRFKGSIYNSQNVLLFLLGDPVIKNLDSKMKDIVSKLK